MLSDKKIDGKTVKQHLLAMGVDPYWIIEFLETTIGEVRCVSEFQRQGNIKDFLISRIAANQAEMLLICLRDDKGDLKGLETDTIIQLRRMIRLLQADIERLKTIKKEK